MNNLFNNSDEALCFETEFAQADEGPSEKYLKSLTKKLNMEEKPQLPKRILGLSPRLFYITISILLFSLVGVSAGVGLIYLNNRQQQLQLEQQALLSEIVRNNPQGITSRSFSTLDAAKNTTGLTALNGTSETMPRVAFTENTYTYSKSVITYGPAATALKQCEPYTQAEGTFENFSHFSQANNSWSKHIQYDANGKILNEYLNTETYTIQYQGGDYAVKTLQKRYYLLDTISSRSTFAVPAETSRTSVISSDDAIADTPVSDSDSISTMFVPDVKILGEETENGKTYYVLSWSFERYCNTNQQQKSVINSWVEKDSKLVYKNEYYQGDAKAENLQYRELLTYSTATVPFSQVANNFKMLTTVDVKEIDLDALYKIQQEQYVAKLMNYWKGLGFDLVAPANYTAVSSASAYTIAYDNSLVNNALKKTYTRNFWPNTAEGQTLYDGFQQGLDPQASGKAVDLIAPERANEKSAYELLLSLNYAIGTETDPHNVLINTYNLTSDFAGIMQNQFGFLPEGITTYEMELNGKKVTVSEVKTAFYYETREPSSEIISKTEGSSPSSPAACPENSTCQGLVLRAFNLNGYTYIVQQDASIKGGKLSSSLSGLVGYSKGSNGYNTILSKMEASLKQ